VAERVAQTAKRLKEAEAGAGRQNDAVSEAEIERMLGEVVDAGYRLLVTHAPKARPQRSAAVGTRCARVESTRLCW
jgi:hypothetical protein